MSARRQTMGLDAPPDSSEPRKQAGLRYVAKIAERLDAIAIVTGDLLGLAAIAVAILLLSLRF